MPNSKSKPSAAFIDKMMGEASWLISHADALGVYGKGAEQTAELGRAAECEEQVAALLDAVGEDLEAAIHRVSAASCHEKIGHYTQAATLFRAALSANLRADFRRDVERYLARCLAKAAGEVKKTARQRKRKPSPALR